MMSIENWCCKTGVGSDDSWKFYRSVERGEIEEDPYFLEYIWDWKCFIDDNVGVVRHLMNWMTTSCVLVYILSFGYNRLILLTRPILLISLCIYMFHIFHWQYRLLDDQWYLDNDLFGIQVIYTWSQEKWTRYLYPVIDTNRSTIKYYAFDIYTEKKRFLELLKIQGIWGKSAHQLASLPTQELQDAIDSFDLKYFQNIPGIWPKTAKRVLLEMKQHVDLSDVKKLDIDQKLYSQIVSSLQWLWYELVDIKKHLAEYPDPLEKDALPSIMKWMINHL